MERDDETEERRRRTAARDGGRGGRTVGAERGRDLQTNLITSPTEWNHFASFGIAHLPEKRAGEREGERDIVKRAATGRGDAVLKEWRKFETCHINFSRRSYQGVGFTSEYSWRI